MKYDRGMIVYTQDPTTLKSYINQMRRWYAGGWQNLMKHYRIVSHPVKAIELTLVYAEGVVFSVLLFLFLLLNPWFFAHTFVPYFALVASFGIYSVKKSERLDLLYYSPAYVLLSFVNSWIFLEQFLKQVILHKRSMVWFHPERVQLS